MTLRPSYPAYETSMKIPFAKVIPGGNATIIVPASAVDHAHLPQVSQKLMDQNHIEAEQVGSLAFANTPSALPHLQMMGGEFCVNATRACASLLANADQLLVNSQGCQAGYMCVSGSPEPILVATAPSADLLNTTVVALQEHEASPCHQGQSPQKTSLPTSQSIPQLPAEYSLSSNPTANWLEHIPSPSLYAGARLSCPLFLPASEDAGTIPQPQSAGAQEKTVGGQSTNPANSSGLANAKPLSIFEQPENGLTLVHLPGISHLLIPVGNKPFPSKEECEVMAARYRSQLGLEALPALGTIWYCESGNRLGNRSGNNFGNKSGDELGNGTRAKTGRRADSLLSSGSGSQLGSVSYSDCGSDCNGGKGCDGHVANNQGFDIFPAVYVKATDSLCLETACGSASLALALHACVSAGAYETQPRSQYAVLQPSGQTLTVIIEKQTASLCHAWVTGPVHIVALGTAFI